MLFNGTKFRPRHLFLHNKWYKNNENDQKMERKTTTFCSEMFPDGSQLCFQEPPFQKRIPTEIQDLPQCDEGKLAVQLCTISLFWCCGVFDFKLYSIVRLHTEAGNYFNGTCNQVLRCAGLHTLVCQNSINVVVMTLISRVWGWRWKTWWMWLPSNRSRRGSQEPWVLRWGQLLLHCLLPSPAAPLQGTIFWPVFATKKSLAPRKKRRRSGSPSRPFRMFIGEERSSCLVAEKVWDAVITGLDTLIKSAIWPS